MLFRLFKLYVLLVVLSLPFNYLLAYAFPSLQITEFTIIDSILCSALVVLAVFVLSRLLVGLIALIQRRKFHHFQAIICGLWVVAHVIPFVGMYVLKPPNL